jgi:hypothetical protein
MSRVGYLYLISACLLIGLAVGQDWLGGGYVSSYAGSDMAQYFTEPIFHPNPIGAQPQGYYPYPGNEFFRDYAYPYEFSPGTYPGPYGVFPYNSEPYYSDLFRLRSLANQQWPLFQKNWSKTWNYASTRSSMKVYQNGKWVSP